jgi:hypothetical protein
MGIQCFLPVNIEAIKGLGVESTLIDQYLFCHSLFLHASRIVEMPQIMLALGSTFYKNSDFRIFAKQYFSK